jgi:hypothetical protein
MSIRCPEESLRKIDRVPVVCVECTYSTSLAEHDESLDLALVNSTYLHELRHELSLLERTEQFFARYPTSKHRLKISLHEDLKTNLVECLACKTGRLVIEEEFFSDCDVNFVRNVTE